MLLLLLASAAVSFLNAQPAHQKSNATLQCSRITSRNNCLEANGGDCAYCIATESCVSEEHNSCPEGCLFEVSSPGLRQEGSRPTCHLKRAPRNVTEYTEAFALRMVKLCGASYCPPDDIQRWTCRGGKCIDGFKSEFLAMDEVYTTLVFAGLDFDEGAQQKGKDPARVVIVFRGTVEVDYMNWVADMDILKTAPFEDKDIQVHRGFYLAYLQLRERLMKYLEGVPKVDLVVTGHSLGASMASICAFDIVTQPDRMGFKSVSTITYGEPRTGNLAFHKAYSRLIPNSWRVTHYKDVIPKVPFQTFGFYHTAREIWYSSRDYKSDDYQVCDGSGEDPKCQNSLWFATSVQDHLYYIGVYLGTGGCIDPVAAAAAAGGGSAGRPSAIADRGQEHLARATEL